VEVILLGLAVCLIFALRMTIYSSRYSAANINDGITIDLSSVKYVNVAADHSAVSIGAGARWADVYNNLEPLGLAVAGGRAAPVGVSGLTLGGRVTPSH